MPKTPETEGDVFVRLLGRLRLAEEASYVLGHYFKEQGSAEELKGQGFLGVGEMFRYTTINITNIATKAMRIKAGLR